MAGVPDSAHDASVNGEVSERLQHVRDAVALRHRSENAVATPDAEVLERWRVATEEAARLADPTAFDVRRDGMAARLERAAKQARGLAAVWSTWPQAKYNEAVVSVLRETGDLLEAQQQWVADLHAAHRAELEQLRMEQHGLRAEIEAVQIRHERALEEHRVVMRQLALEVSEAAQLADRTRRRVEHRLDGG
jgi:hypothetical protein